MLGLWIQVEDDNRSYIFMVWGGGGWSEGVWGLRGSNSLNEIKFYYLSSVINRLSLFDKYLCRSMYK